MFAFVDLLFFAVVGLSLDALLQSDPLAVLTALLFIEVMPGAGVFDPAGLDVALGIEILNASVLGLGIAVHYHGAVLVEIMFALIDGSGLSGNSVFDLGLFEGLPGVDYSTGLDIKIMPCIRIFDPAGNGKTVLIEVLDASVGADMGADRQLSLCIEVVLALLQLEFLIGHFALDGLLLFVGLPGADQHALVFGIVVPVLVMIDPACHVDTACIEILPAPGRGLDISAGDHTALIVEVMGALGNGGRLSGSSILDGKLLGGHPSVVQTALVLVKEMPGTVIADPSVDVQTAGIEILHALVGSGGKG